MANSGAENDRLVFGWREWILFEGKKMALRAKFDTGARTSCIHAEGIGHSLRRVTGKDVAGTIIKFIEVNAKEGKTRTRGNG